MTLEMMIPGGMVLHGQAKADTPGLYIAMGDFAWFDGVDMRRDTSELPQAHGSFDVPGFLGSRTVPVKGFCVAESEEELEHVGNRLTGMLADGDSGTVQVKWNNETTWANVRLGAQTKFAPDRAALVGEFLLTFWAANPRKFGEAVVFPNEQYSLAQVHHRGNFPATPVLTISGSAPEGYTVWGPGGRRYVVTRALVAGAPHVVDMATGRLTIHGVRQARSTSLTQRWALPGGQQFEHSVVPVSGTASLTVTVPPTFI